LDVGLKDGVREVGVAEVDLKLGDTVGTSVGMTEGVMVGNKVGAFVGIAVEGERVVAVLGITVGIGLLIEHAAHTFKNLAVLSQASLPKTVLVARTLQEFNPRHDEVIVAVVVFKAQVEVRNDPQSLPVGVPYEAKGNPEI
jgi:hypothetical protein